MLFSTCHYVITKLISGTIHLARIKMRNTQKKFSRKAGRGKNLIKKMCKSENDNTSHNETQK
jgi:hypothetical protein